MALKRKDNGEYVLTSQKQVISALNLMQELQSEITSIQEEHGLDEMMVDAVELKKAAERYLIANEIDKLELGDGQYASVIRGGHDRHWILTDAQLREEGATKAKSLRSILKKKFAKDKDAFKEVWNRISKRTADPAGIEEVVSEGLLSEKEIEKAYVEKDKKPYMRIYGSKDD